MDHGEVTVVAGKRQVTPSLVDIASSAERLSKLTVSGDHTKPVSSDLSHARTSAIAAAAATAKATLGDSVKRAYVMLPYEDVSRISVLLFPTSLTSLKARSNSHVRFSLQCLTHSCAAMTDAQRAYERPRGYPVGTPAPPGIHSCHND